jgi:hypothetical protein
MAKCSILTAARLREMADYNPETGEFRWLERKKGRQIVVGSLRGTKQKYKYIRVKIDYVTYSAHRLAWLWMTGNWPAQDIDHINRDPIDNRWSNLRDVSKSENSKNKRVSNASGLPGVYFNKKTRMWQSSLYLGSFQTKEGAHEAYQAARLSVFPPHIQFGS